MSPILIDNRDLVKLGVITVILTILVFVGGYSFGYHQSKSAYLASSEGVPLKLPFKKLSDASEVEQPRSDVIEAGEVIDVDQPEKLVSKKLSQEEKTKLPESVAVKENPANKIEPESVAAVPTNDVSRKDVKAVVSTIAQPVIVTKDMQRNAKYSIQVGMYGRLDYAQVLAEKLKLKGLNAYVSDYLNKEKSVRFNVRFGYFSDRKSAESALASYKNKLNGDGYLVNYSVDKLIHSVERDVTLVPEKVSTKVVDKQEQVNSVENLKSSMADDAGKPTYN